MPPSRILKRRRPQPVRYQPQRATAEAEAGLVHALDLLLAECARAEVQQRRVCHELPQQDKR